VKKAAPPTSGDRLIYWDEKDSGLGLMVTDVTERPLPHHGEALQQPGK
jgi:hypothetical protein